MWNVLRHTLTRTAPRATQTTTLLTTVRRYASKNKEKHSPKPVVSPEPVTAKGSHANPTSNLIPKSQRTLTDDAAQAEYDKASAKMATAVDWYRKEVAGLEARGVGRVTPAILDPVRVTLPDSPSTVRLQEVATVGIREGTNLVITLFDGDYAKHVEKAIYAAKIPNVVPQKVDERTLKIVIPRPTMEARTALLSTASQSAEATRVQIRKTRDASVRKHKWKPRSDEIEQFQKLCDLKIKEVDQILAKAKKELGS